MLKSKKDLQVGEDVSPISYKRKVSKMTMVAHNKCFRILSLLFFAITLSLSSVSSDLLAEEAGKDAGAVKKANLAKYSSNAALKTDAELSELMDRAELFAKEENYRNASVLWQRIVEKGGDSLHTHDGEVYYSVLRVIEERISQLPEGGMRVYRISADKQTGAILAAAKGKMDGDAYNEIVDRYFHGSFGDDAAYALGCIALDEHDYSTAIRLFNKIIQQYPSPSVPLGKVHLRLALANAAVNDVKEARTAIATAREIADDKILPLIEAVEKTIGTTKMVIHEQQHVAAPPETAMLTDLSSGEVVRYELGAGTRESAVRYAGKLSPGKDDKVLVSSWRKNNWFPAGQLRFNGHNTYFRTYNDIIGLSEVPEETWQAAWLNHYELDARTRSKNIFTGHGNKNSGLGTEQETFCFADRIHHSMLLHGERLYTLEGQSYLSTRPKGSQHNVRHGFGRFGNVLESRWRTNFLTAYDTETGAMEWTRPAFDADDVTLLETESEEGEEGEEEGGKTAEERAAEAAKGFGFMGPPVPYKNLLLCPVNASGVIVILAINSNTGETVWKSHLCDESSSNANPHSPIHLAIEGRDVYAVTGGGVVFALDASSGIMRFAKKYKRSVKTERNQYTRTDIEVPIGWDDDVIIPHGNALVVLASDCKDIFAIDRSSGEFLWRASIQSDKPHGPHRYCLGVLGNTLYVAGRSFLVGYDLSRDGLITGQQEFVDGEKSYGRGFVCSTGVFLPIENSIAHFNLDCKTQIRRVGVSLDYNLPVGNLFCDGKQLWTVSANCIYKLAGVKQVLLDLETKIKAGDFAAILDRLKLYSILKRNDNALQDLKVSLAHVKSKNDFSLIVRSLLDSQLYQKEPVKTQAHLLEYIESVKGKAQTDVQEIITSQLLYPLSVSITDLQNKDVVVKSLLNSLRLTKTNNVSYQLFVSRTVEKQATKKHLDALAEFLQGYPEHSFAIQHTIGRLMGKDAIADFKKLDSNESPLVRLGAALELVKLGEQESFPTIVSLLSSDEAPVRALSCRVLKALTGENFKFEAYNAVSDTRTKQIKEIEKWIESKGDDLALKPIGFLGDLEHGRILICSQNSSLVEYDIDNFNTPTWKIRMPGISSAVGLKNGGRLVAVRNKVIEYDILGTETWSHTFEDFNVSSAQRLENGNTLIGAGMSLSGGMVGGPLKANVLEITPSGETVWQCKVEERLPTSAVRRLEDGNTLIVVGVSMYKVNPAGKTLQSKKPEKGARLGYGYGTAAHIKKNGNALLATNNRITEYDGSIKKVWSNSVKNMKKINCITQNSQGQMFVGLARGVALIDKDGSTEWTKQQGLKNIKSISTY